VVFYAFNPLVVIESLVSGHNDSAMMAVLFLAFWLLVNNKNILAWLSFLFSAGIKFATGFLFPILIIISWFQAKKKKINWEVTWAIAWMLMLTAVVVASYRIGEIKPWYWLYLIPFAALTVGKHLIQSLTISLSLGLLLHYSLFLYLGNWDPPVPAIKKILILAGTVLGLTSWLMLKSRIKTSR
jgi:hypothetical protein